MGSVLSLSTAVPILLITGGVIYGFLQKHPAPPDWNAKSVTLTPSPTASEKKKGKKKKGGKSEDSAAPSSTVEPMPTVVPFPAVVPGGFESHDSAVVEPSAKAKAKKKKSKKTANASTGASGSGVGGGTRAIPLDAQSESSATAPESSTPVSRPSKSRKSPPILDTDGPWTRVESRKRSDAQPARNVGLSPSDTGITTSVTETSSVAAEHTEDEPEDNQRTLAEKLLPKARKTGVEDMVETPDVPTLARVMRVQPRSDERPAVGFSWADYEDVDDARALTGDDDADGEDEGGWVVKSSRTRTRSTKPSTTSQPRAATPEQLTKKQRQNLARKEAQKTAKADAEAERLAALAKHKRELERIRIAESSSASKGKKQSGGMSASLNEKGHLVWD